jgi:NAD(P)-dependent dehydrogenase (short-subunit alcohol dehydrogenase family)
LSTTPLTHPEQTLDDRPRSSRGARPGGRLQGRIALVTGGSRGIGRAVAEALAVAGADVSIVARSEAAIGEMLTTLRSIGGRAEGVAADVTDRAATERAIKVISDRLGSPDILVNNAGSLQVTGPFWEIDPDDWWLELEGNLRGAVICTSLVLPGMMAQGRGTVINVSSISALGRNGYDSAYSAAKSALNRFTASLATEAGPHGIQSFAVHPGTVRTRLTDRLLRSAEGKRHFAFLNSLKPHEWAEPDELARLCVRLAAGDAPHLSGYFVSAVDTPSHVLWRNVGRAGLLWRELSAMLLRRGW